MSEPDPFASAPTPPPAPEPEPAADEAQADEGAFDAPPEEAKPKATRAKASTSKATTAPPVVVNQSEGKVVLTFKGGRDYDAPWIVVHANDLDEATEYVTTKATKFLELMTRVQNAAQHFAGLAPEKPKGTGSGASNGGGERKAPAAATQAPNGETRECQHGAMQYRTGSKNGRTWRAFFCPTPKGTSDQCKAEFLKD